MNLIFMQKEYLIILFALLILDSCGLDIEDSTPPSTPQWIEKSMPDDWPERGVDAHQNSAIFLEWEESIDQDIVGYDIYRAEWDDTNDSMSDYGLIAKLESGSLQRNEYSDDQAHTRVGYFYKLRSRNDSDNESSFSDSVYYELLPSVRLQTMTPNGVSDTLGESRLLSWQYIYTIEMENYQVTILTETNELVYRSTFLPGDYTSSSNEKWKIPMDVILESGNIYKWRIDTAANYISERETSGSESDWGYFYFL